jgi:hypothetical protein
MEFIVAEVLDVSQARFVAVIVTPELPPLPPGTYTWHKSRVLMEAP